MYTRHVVHVVTHPMIVSVENVVREHWWFQFIVLMLGATSVAQHICYLGCFIIFYIIFYVFYYYFNMHTRTHRDKIEMATHLISHRSVRIAISKPCPGFVLMPRIGLPLYTSVRAVCMTRGSILFLYIPHPLSPLLLYIYFYFVFPFSFDLNDSGWWWGFNHVQPIIASGGARSLSRRHI